jgi:hypothetical protein
MLRLGILVSAFLTVKRVLFSIPCVCSVCETFEAIRFEIRDVLNLS